MLNHIVVTFVDWLNIKTKTKKNNNHESVNHSEKKKEKPMFAISPIPSLMSFVTRKFIPGNALDYIFTLVKSKQSKKAYFHLCFINTCMS